jgi:hypothetical protein
LTLVLPLLLPWWHFDLFYFATKWSVFNMAITTSKMGYVCHSWDFEHLAMENFCWVVVAIYWLAVGRQAV